MKLLPLVAVLLVVGCSDGRPLTCEAARANWDECVDEYLEAGDTDALLNACFPAVEPTTMRGTWATAWEHNEYIDGEFLTYEQAFAPRRESIYLVTDGTTLEAAEPGTEQSDAFHIEFVGKMTPCEMMPDYEIVVIDRLISATRVPKPANQTTE